MAIVTLTAAKLHLQISNSAEDELIQLMIKQAQEFVSEYTGIYFHEGDGSVSELLDGGTEYLWPTKLPVHSVTSVKDAENDDADSDWKNTDSRIMRDRDGLPWGRGIQRWQTTYTAGYDADSAPSGLVFAVLDLVARAFRNRGGKVERTDGAEWQTFADSDIMKRLQPYRMTRMVG